MASKYLLLLSVRMCKSLCSRRLTGLIRTLRRIEHGFAGGSVRIGRWAYPAAGLAAWLVPALGGSLCCHSLCIWLGRYDRSLVALSFSQGHTHHTHTIPKYTPHTTHHTYATNKTKKPGHSLGPAASDNAVPNRCARLASSLDWIKGLPKVKPDPAHTNPRRTAPHAPPQRVGRYPEYGAPNTQTLDDATFDLSGCPALSGRLACRPVRLPTKCRDATRCWMPMRFVHVGATRHRNA